MTNGTFLSFLNLEELSITLHPCSTAFGAKFSAILAPAEKKAKSTSEKLNFERSETLKTCEPQANSIP